MIIYGTHTARKAAAAVWVVAIAFAGVPAPAVAGATPEEGVNVPAGVGVTPGVDVPAAVAAPQRLLDVLERAATVSPALLTLDRERKLAESRYRAGVAALDDVTVRVETPVQFERPVEGGAGEGGAVAAVRVTKPFGSASSVDVSVGAGAGWSEAEQRFVAAPHVNVGVVHSVGEAGNPARARLEYELAVAEHAVADGRRKWVRDVLDAYAALVGAETSNNAAEARLRLETVRLAAAQNRRRDGTSSVNELEEATAQVDEVAGTLALTQVAVVEAKQALRLLTGVDVPDGAPPTSRWDARLHAVLRERIRTGTGDASTERARAASVAEALSGRAELELARSAADIARNELAYARRQTGWTGKVGAGVTYPDADGDVATWDEASPVWRLSATVSFPVVGGDEDERVEQAMLKLEQADAHAELTRREIAAEVTTGLLRVQAARGRLDRADARRARAAHLVRVAKDGRAAGIDTELSVLAAEFDLAEAQRVAAEARLDVLKETVHLWHVMGRNVAW